MRPFKEKALAKSSVDLRDASHSFIHRTNSHPTLSPFGPAFLFLFELSWTNLGASMLQSSGDALDAGTQPSRRDSLTSGPQSPGSSCYPRTTIAGPFDATVDENECFTILCRNLFATRSCSWRVACRTFEEDTIDTILPRLRKESARLRAADKKSCHPLLRAFSKDARRIRNRNVNKYLRFNDF